MRGMFSVLLVAAAGMAAPAMAQGSWPQRTGGQENAAGEFNSPDAGASPGTSPRSTPTASDGYS